MRSGISFPRNHELERERDWKVHQRLFQHEREVNRIQTTPPPVSSVGREHEVNARKQEWSEPPNVEGRTVTTLASFPCKQGRFIVR